MRAAWRVMWRSRPSWSWISCRWPVPLVDRDGRDLPGQGDHRRAHAIGGEQRRRRVQHAGAGHHGEGLRPARSPARRRAPCRPTVCSCRGWITRIRSPAALRGVEQMVVVHAGQRVQRVDAVSQQGVDDGFGGGHAWHGWSRGWIEGDVLTQNRAGLHIACYHAGALFTPVRPHWHCQENAMTTFRAVLLAGALACAGLSGGVAAADTIRIGMSVSTTGPAASLGIPQRNTVSILPKQIAGQTVEYFVLDDGTDATRGVANMRKLIDEDNVDAMIGSSATPASAAMSTVAAEKHVPLIVLAASAVADPADDAREVLGVQGAAERQPDGRCDRRAHGEERGEDGGVHRLQRRLRRRLADRNRARCERARHPCGGRGTLRPPRYQRDRAGFEDHGREAGRRADRRCRHPRGAAAEDTEGARLQRALLPDPRRRQCRLPARRRQGRGRHFPAGRPDRGGRTIARSRTRSRRSGWTTSIVTRRHTERVRHRPSAPTPTTPS